MDDYFVGRDEQLRFIDDLLENANKYIYLFGPGGIGKTKFLIEVRRKYVGLGYKCPQLIDLSKSEVRNISGMLIAITTELGIGQFGECITQVNLLSSAHGDKHVLIEQKMEELFLQEYEMYTNKHRTILIFDTFESLSKTELATSFLPQLIEHTSSYSKIIFASRLPKTPQSFPKNVGDKFELPGLSPDDVSALVKIRYNASGINTLPDEKSIQDICYLSNCNPLIVDLSICAILETGKQQEILSASGEEFKKKIIGWILDLPLMEQQGIKQASVLNRRFNSEIMSAINNKPLSECVRVLDELYRFPFVRSLENPEQRVSLDFRLHDEFRFMVKKYLIEDSYTRTFLYPAIINFYKTNYENTLNNRTADYARVERIHYELLLNNDDGFKSWENNFEEYLGKYELEICGILLDEISNLRHNFTKIQQYKSYLLEGELLLARYNPLAAFPKFQYLASSFTDAIKYPEITIGALSGLGQCITNNCTIVDKDKLTDALQHLENALALADSNDIKIDSKLLGSLLENLGLVYQLLGDHSAAEKYYLQSLDFFKSNNNYKKQGELLDKLGSLYREQYKTDKALESLEQSIELKSKAIDKRGIAITYSRMALACVDNNDFEKSENLYIKARDILIDVNDEAELATVYGGLAWLKYIASRIQGPEKQKYLDKAEEFARQAIKISEEKGFGRSLSRDYHTLFHILDAKNNIREAEIYIRKSCDFARRYSDLFMLFDDLSHVSKIEYERGEYSNLRNYLQEIENFERRGAKFSVFKGRIFVILGHVELRNGNIHDAIELYDQGWEILVQRRTSSTVPKLSIEISDFTNTLSKLPIAHDCLVNVIMALLNLWETKESSPDWNIVINHLKGYMLGLENK